MLDDLNEHIVKFMSIDVFAIMSDICQGDGVLIFIYIYPFDVVINVYFEIFGVRNFLTNFPAITRFRIKE